MPQIAPEPIETPAHDALHAMAPHIGDELVERGSAVLRAADAAVDVLDRGPAAGGDVAAQLQQLVLRVLVVPADARVEGDLHREPPDRRPLPLPTRGVLRVTPFLSSHARKARSTWT